MNGARELLVGSVIIVSIVVTVVGTLWLQGINFGRPQQPVYVLLESVAQLRPGNAVVYRGVRIGRVDAIEFDPAGDDVRLLLLIDGQVALPEDAAVVLGPQGIFGDWQAEIVSRATVPDFPFYEVPLVPVSDTITYGGWALPELTRLTASAEQISQNVAELTDRLELAFNQETANNLAQAIGNLEDITEQVRVLVQQQGEVAASLTANADSALAEIEIAATAARRSFEHLEGVMTSQQLDSILANAQEATAGLREITAGLQDPDTGLQSTIAELDSAFASINRVTSMLEAGEGSLGRLLVDSTFAVRAEDVLLELSVLLQDFRENPRRYVRLSIF